MSKFEKSFAGGNPLKADELNQMAAAINDNDDRIVSLLENKTKLTELETEVNRLFGGKEYIPQLGHYGISSTTGQNGAYNPTRLSTEEYIVANQVFVYSGSGKYYVFGYDKENNYIGNSGGFISEDKLIEISGSTKYRITFAKKTEGVAFDIEEYDSIGFKVYSCNVLTDEEAYLSRVSTQSASIKDIENLSKEVDNCIKKEYSSNLINPNDIEVGAALPFNNNGAYSTGLDSIYKVTGFIPVNGNNIITNAFHVSGAWSSMFIYDKNKKWLRNNGVSEQYTYVEGDAFIRISYNKSKLRDCLANYGTELLPYTAYTDYKPIAELSERINKLDGGLEKTDIKIFPPNAIYQVYISAKRNYTTNLYLSHYLQNIAYKNEPIFFSNKRRVLPFYPSKVTSSEEKQVNIEIEPTKYYNKLTTSVLVRTSNVNVSKLSNPRILVIGDSVTNGYGANSNKSAEWLPNQYWAFAKMLYEMDKIDGGDNVDEHNALFIGGVTAQGNFTIKYNNVERAVRANAEATGGASLGQLFTEIWGNESVLNPFFNGTTFSIKDYVAKYRTMDDRGVRLVCEDTNPSGKSVVGSDGKTYIIGSAITSLSLLSKYDVCNPEYIVINLNHNTSYNEWVNNISNILQIIRTEYTDIPIILMSIDETGTYFPEDYPEYVADDITIGKAIHYKNNQIYQYNLLNLENENNGIYVLAAQYIQPTAKSFPTVVYQDAETMYKDETRGVNIANPSVGAPEYHPNNYAHSAWGYCLYAILKWIVK